MSLIVSEVYDALIDAGSSVEKARAAAAAIPGVEHMATKEDIARLEKKIAVLNVAVFSLGPAILAMLVMLVKLTFFA